MRGNARLLHCEKRKFAGPDGSPGFTPEEFSPWDCKTDVGVSFFPPERELPVTGGLGLSTPYVRRAPTS